MKTTIELIFFNDDERYSLPSNITTGRKENLDYIAKQLIIENIFCQSPHSMLHQGSIFPCCAC